MHRFFPTIIGPLMSRLDPKIVVEIGCADGVHTRLLLEDCKKREAIFHAVDPEPQFDVDDLTKKNPGSFVFHRMISTDALPTLPKADLVLIDGDHNYFTVTQELAILCADPASMPVILFHDVDWPYGRRDMYHDPKTLPPEAVHPYQQKGLAIDRSGIVKEGRGMNATMFHAEIEGGPRNGVLTAVEDAMKTMNSTPRFVLVPGFHGLGILAPERTKKSHPDAWAFLDLLTLTEPMQVQIRALERDRITARYEYEREAVLHQRAQDELRKKQ